MFKLKIINPPNIKIENSILEKILINLEKAVKDKKQNWTVNVVFIEKEEIKNLNKEYRNKDKETDVLSFHYHDDYSNLSKEDIAWEVLMVEQILINQAKEYELSPEKEFYKLLIHSLVHLLWYDHETDKDYKIMKEKEDIIWKELF